MPVPPAADAWRDESTLRFVTDITRNFLANAQTAGLDTRDTRGAVAIAVRDSGVDHYYYADQNMHNAGDCLAAGLIARHLEQKFMSGRARRGQLRIASVTG